MQATSDAHTLLGSTNGGEKGAMSERKLDALILNMERVAACMEKSHTGIYKRVINTYDIGNPGPVGMFAFALSLAFYMTSQARLTEQSALFIAFTFAMFLGGLTLQIAGWLELLRKNSLGACAFVSYGSFYMTVGVYGIIRAAGIFFLESPKGEQAIVIIMGFASLSFFVVSLRTNKSQPFFFINLAIMFFLLAGGIENATCARVAGWWGLFTSLAAFYGATAVLLRDMWGRDVLPQWYTREYVANEKLWFPRATANPTTFEIEDGWQKKGRAF